MKLTTYRELITFLKQNNTYINHIRPTTRSLPDHNLQRQIHDRGDVNRRKFVDEYQRITDDEAAKDETSTIWRGINAKKWEPVVVEDLVFMSAWPYQPDLLMTQSIHVTQRKKVAMTTYRQQSKSQTPQYPIRSSYKLLPIRLIIRSDIPYNCGEASRWRAADLCIERVEDGGDILGGVGCDALASEDGGWLRGDLGCCEGEEGEEVEDDGLKGVNWRSRGEGGRADFEVE